MFARLKHQSRDFSRWLSLLLVVFIFYGTTVEAAHRHGGILPTSSGAASRVENEQTQNLTSKTGCSDCLICQLHQNFTTTLISLRLTNEPTPAPQRVEIVVARDLRSQIVGPSPGRAPPFIS